MAIVNLIGGLTDCDAQDQASLAQKMASAARLRQQAKIHLYSLASTVRNV